MNKQDFKEFSETWMNAHEVSSSNSAQSNGAIRYAFDLLNRYSVDNVKKAILIHGSRSSFAPTPADVIALLETSYKHLSYGEAWALCPKSDMDTVVWTNEIAQAWAACSDIYNDGDKIGAKMAFKGAYERICNLAEIKRIRPSWVISVGDNKALTKVAVDNAVLIGRLTAEQAAKALPTIQGGGFIGKMLTGRKIEENDESAKKGIKKLKKILEDVDKNMEARRLARIDEIKDKKKQFEERRKSAIEYCEKGMVNGNQSDTENNKSDDLKLDVLNNSMQA